MTRTFSDGHPKVLPACNFLSQYYFYNIFLQKSCRFSLQTLRSSRRRKPEVALDFCVWPLCDYLEYGSHLARLHRRRRRRAYAPTSNTASHDNHEKINSWVSFCSPYEYGAPLGGLAAGAPLLCEINTFPGGSKTIKNVRKSRLKVLRNAFLISDVHTLGP